jgi:hypothetical protein
MRLPTKAFERIVKHRGPRLTGDATFALDATQEADLIEAIAEAERGELIDAVELVKRLQNCK